MARKDAMQDVPRFEPLYLSEYIDYWRDVYKGGKGGVGPPATEALLQLEAHAEAHLCKHFHRLRLVIDDDHFEWNMAMVVFVALCQWRSRAPPVAVHKDFLRAHNLLPPRADTLADAVLLVKHIDDRWGRWPIADLPDVRQYVLAVHRALAKFVVRTHTLKAMNRWNFIDAIGREQFRLKPNGIMYLCAHACLHLKSLRVASILKDRITPAPFAVEQHHRDHFYAFVAKQETYYSIRTFRMRISAFVYMFMHDEAERCVHTYTRAGEVPTIYSSVTSKYPSGHIGNLSHDILYAEHRVLIHHDNEDVRDGNLLALFEAIVKTLYTLDFVRYCYCWEHNVVDMQRQLDVAVHPVLVRAWGKWGVVHAGKFHPCKALVDAILLWVMIVQEHHACTVLKTFNLTNLVRQCLPLNAPAEESDESGEAVFEVCL